ncbi:MAG: phenylalanine--tRNA ligase subunit alpha, partial [Coriobacteriales bacterium]|nr:phenylalanine--tRNA ligase subunit alpha [Coriobacteriales bacterium]
MGIKEDLEKLREDTLSAISSAVDLATLEEIRIRVLGKKGSLTKFLRSMQDVPKELKPEIGKLVNTARNLIDHAIEQRLAILKSQELEKKLQSSAIDTSLPGRANTIGSQHLINNIIEEVSDIFSAIGYSIVPGTEVETDYYNFTALNAPKDHPSRSTTDTFYIMDGSENLDDLSKPTDFLLRTQTSGTQVHVMETQKPPIYMISPGKVYRRDVADPSAGVQKILCPH